MKSILYAGATLMIGAAIYGFVDYKKTSDSKEFTKMYDAKETTEPAVASHKTKDVIVQKETTINEKTRVTKNQPVKKIIPETKTTTISSPDESSTTIKYNTARRKKLSYRLFSRAPLEEKYIDKELKVKEPEKTEIKEQ